MTNTAGSDPLEHRPQLLGLAYRILGSAVDAEDAVQEAYLRLHRQSAGTIDNVGGWLRTVTSRICLDRLGSAQARRERYVGDWLPEPITTLPDAAEQLELAESVSMAFLVVLETLSPPERIAFLLHDVFGDDYTEIAVTLERSETACRQLVSRARKHVQMRRPRFEHDPNVRAQVAERFLAASTTGAVDDLLTLLAPDVSLHVDGGGKASAGLRPVHGPDHIVRYIQGVAKTAAQLHLTVRWLNGSPGLIAQRPDGSVDTAFVLDVADGVVGRINVIRNPDKLTHLARPSAAP
jgi:RNA polymerase sigma-70 factor, ECF subfamily